MEFSVSRKDPSQVKVDCLVLGVFAKRQLSAGAQALPQATQEYLQQVLKHGDIEGEPGQSLLLYQVPGLEAQRLLLVGGGKLEERSAANFRKLMAGATAQLEAGYSASAALLLKGLPPDSATGYQSGRDLVMAAEEALYRFTQTKSQVEKPRRPLKRLQVLIPDSADEPEVKRGLEHGRAIAAGMSLAKDLGNLPGNICTPSYLADQAKALAQDEKALEVTILEEKDMDKLGMKSLLSVSRGSRQPPKLIQLEYRGGSASEKPVVLVGKGLTFDAGGISLKPAQAMDEMKYDMCGGASVLGVIKACLRLQLPLNLIGVIPSSENLPDGNANKPGDIVTSMSGQTIEILNTDAEGRLILCDALTYSERFKPAVVIDIATLTGACVVALGKHASGLMSQQDELADALISAGNSIGDRAWRLPLWEDYQEQLKSNFADMANVGGKEAGAITGASFLARFTKKLNWAHLDIAGTAWIGGDKKGATGRPVPLLMAYLLNRAAQGN